MLRVGLTGELGSGKSTVAHMLTERGAVVLSSDDIARRVVQPGEPAYQAIVQQFGPTAILPGGSLNRKALAEMAFDPHNPRIEELNAIVHPPVIAEQERRIALLARTRPDAIVIIESALIFTTKHAGDGPWQHRFDRIILVTAPDDVKIERYVRRIGGDRALPPAEREALELDARQRLAAQRIPDHLAADCIRIENTGSLAALERRTDQVYRELLDLQRP